MNTITISTTQNIDIDYDVAGLGERLAARLIDLAIFGGLYVAGIIFAALLLDSVAGGAGFIVLIVIFACLYVFYDLICEVFYNGQSIGKRALKIKVISLDGGQPTLGQYLLRWLFRFVDFSLTGGLGALITVAVTDKKQRIGDIVANTTLIKTTPRTGSEAIAFQHDAPDEDYEPVFPESSALTDGQLTLVHEVLQAYFSTGNQELVHNMAEKVREYLKVTIPEKMNALQFLQTVVKDYNHIYSKSV